jgi:hypothetical protein
MPDANGNVKGQGWSRKREEGWDRIFGRGPIEVGARVRLRIPGYTHCRGEVTKEAAPGRWWVQIDDELEEMLFDVGELRRA